MTEITVKKIDVSTNMYVLCVPDDNNYYSFYVCHKKNPAVLKLFNNTAVRDPGDDVLQYLAVTGWQNAKTQYMGLAAFIDTLK